MGKKIFVSYKYSDASVYGQGTTARDYVDALQDLLTEEDHIYKGEDDGEDLSDFIDSTIGSKLSDKIYDSTVSIIMISPNMKESYKPESTQWIPWEVAYSLKEQSRAGQKSKTNAVIAVVLPDSNNTYNYFIEDDTCQYCHCRTLKTNTLFQILKNNMFNIKEPVFNGCRNHGESNPAYKGHSSYIYSVKWKDFTNNVNYYLDKSLSIKQSINKYNICKQVKL